jgi:hypothetical protein
MALLQNKSSRNNAFKDFREGLFKIASYKKAEKVAEKITMIKQYYDGYKRRSFVFAMMNLFQNEEYNHAEFLHKLSFQSIRLVDCTTVKQYISLVEDIYNYHRKDKIRLY